MTQDRGGQKNPRNSGRQEQEQGENGGGVCVGGGGGTDTAVQERRS